MRDDPAVDIGHHLVTHCRRHEGVGAERAAVAVDHAQQQFVVRRLLRRKPGNGAMGCACRRSRLWGERLAHARHHVDVGKAADDALVGNLVGRDTIAAAVLGGLAGGLGGGQRMRQFAAAAVLQRRDADADRNVDFLPWVQRAQHLGADAQRFSKAARVIDLGRQQHGEPITGDACGQRPGGQTAADQFAELADDGVNRRACRGCR